MDRFWIKQYPPGTPADIDPNEYSSVKQLIEQSCQQFAARTAYLQMGFRLSYAQLDQLSATFAAWLQA
ncbi:MAG TPA: long-chain-fatty-acid--CoA ligase, partial [Chloroflexota bacterium]|nr:long-chain-fatty-acid--CoA ligase [Chloroflexota bacterium]